MISFILCQPVKHFANGHHHISHFTLHFQTATICTTAINKAHSMKKSSLNLTEKLQRGKV